MMPCLMQRADWCTFFKNCMQNPNLIQEHSEILWFVCACVILRKWVVVCIVLDFQQVCDSCHRREPKHWNLALSFSNASYNAEQGGWEEWVCVHETSCVPDTSLYGCRSCLHQLSDFGELLNTMYVICKIDNDCASSMCLMDCSGDSEG